MGLAIVLAIRLTVPLTIFRWPLLGGLLSIIADSIDIVIFDIAGFPAHGSYQEWDKALDCFYLAIEVIVAQQWQTLPRVTATGLFAYRMIGVTLFEVTDARPLLLVFPNLFELYFLFVLTTKRFYPAYELTPRRTIGWLGALLIPKLGQEYLLHYARVLDDLVATDVIGDWWRTVRDRLH